MTLKDVISKLGYDDKTIKLDYVEYDEESDESTLYFVYSKDKQLSNIDVEKITTALKPYFDNVCNYTVKLKMSNYDRDVVLKDIQQYVAEKYKAFCSIFDNNIKFERNTDCVNLIVNSDKMTENIVIEQGIKDDILNYLNSKYFIKIDMSFDNNKLELEDLNTNKYSGTQDLMCILTEENKINTLDISDIQTFIGKTIEQKPDFIQNIKSNDGENIVCAGTISKINKSTFIKKAKDENSEDVEKTKFSFKLTDVTGDLNVILFPTDKDVQRVDLLQEGQEVLVSGKVKIFNNNISYRINNISLCKINTKEWKYIYRGVNNDYSKIKPQPMSEVSQMDLFSVNNTSNNKEYWDNHTVVMFDLETTGLDPNSCKIIEIGAVKIKNGTCVETFQTLINPEEEISAEITNLTHITNEMVADMPVIDDVMPDFYKFVDGCVLSAYNIGFDAEFLRVIGQNLRYKFDNEKVDALELARQKIPSLHNYKLGTVVKAMNIELNNAHRALADAIAAAKVFIKLI